MTWAGIGDSDVPSIGDLEDAVTTGALQRIGVAPLDETVMPFVADMELSVYSLHALAAAAGDDWLAKSDYAAARFWDPATNAVTGLGADTGTGLTRVSVTWADDAGIPSADGGWARDDMEIVVLRATSSGGTYVEVGTSNYGVGAYADRDAGLVTGDTYWYQVRYRSQADSSATGSLVGPVSAVAGDGMI